MGDRVRVHLFRYVTNQPPKANSAFHPSGVGKWIPASAGKAKAGMAHSVSGWTRGVQVKLWDPLRTRAIPERLSGVFTTKRYTNPRLPYLTWPKSIHSVYSGRQPLVAILFYSLFLHSSDEPGELSQIIAVYDSIINVMPSFEKHAPGTSGLPQPSGHPRDVLHFTASFFTFSKTSTIRISLILLKINQFYHHL